MDQWMVTPNFIISGLTAQWPDPWLSVAGLILPSEGSLQFATIGARVAKRRGPSRRRYVCNGSVNEGHSLKGVLAKRAGNCWDAMLLHLMLRYAWCANFLRKEIFNGQRIHTGIVLRRAAFGDAQAAPETAETIEIVETGETGETGEPIMEDVGGSALEAMG